MKGNIMKKNNLFNQLKNKTTIGRKVYYRTKGDMKSSKPEFIGKIIDEVSVMDNDPEYKHFVQKIKRKDGTIQYRICYYTLDKKKNKIVFGQFASEIPYNSFKKLISKVLKKKGFLQ